MSNPVFDVRVDNIHDEILIGLKSLGIVFR